MRNGDRCLCRMSMHKGPPEPHKPAGPLPLAKLVQCLQKLGGVGEAQLTFKRHMPTQVIPLTAITIPFLCGPKNIHSQEGPGHPP